jgi:hypothetical protein
MNNQLTSTSKLAIIIQQGRVLDFIDGKTQRLETPEEYVRQEVAKSLVCACIGSSIPEIHVGDLQRFEVVRLKPADESAIAEISEASAKARPAADILERKSLPKPRP